MEEYIQDKLRIEGLAHKTRGLYALSFRYLKEIYGVDFSIHNLTRESIDKFKDHLLKQGNSRTTINDYLRNLRASFVRLMMDGKIDRNPFYRFKPLKEERTRKALTLSELREFLKFAEQNASPDLYHLIRIYAGTGRRRKEILYLKREDVNLEKKTYYPVNIKSRENDKLVRTIPDNLMDDFKYFLDTDRDYPLLFCHPDTITHWVTALFRKAGYQGYSLHSLRHTYLTILNEMNYSVRQAQRIIDHKNILTTTRYFHDDVPDSPDIGI